MKPERAVALHEQAYRILGVDLTTIPGISVLHVQAIVPEIGSDLSNPERGCIQFMDGAVPT